MRIRIVFERQRRTPETRKRLEVIGVIGQGRHVHVARLPRLAHAECRVGLRVAHFGAERHLLFKPLQSRHARARLTDVDLVLREQTVVAQIVVVRGIPWMNLIGGRQRTMDAL
ncbi:hypothetical protein [Paraburkholderia sp. J63]|uniref:hypothetical protein n=1 Tax=Paraburkholderia sp. J63 TaxID=2805434 RepID=UPI0039F44782